MASAIQSYHNNVVAAPDIKGEECGMDNSLPSSTGSVSTNATNATVELEKRFQQALTLKDDTQHQIMDDAEVNQVTQEELDSLYAKDMFELTGQEREEALQDIHGVSDTIEETPEFVQEHRQHLQQELLLLVSRPRHKTFAYQQAMKQDTSYVCSREFQVLFLRADRWRARDAAARLIAFLETKLELFGSQLLTKRITISHLSKDDRKSLESGFFQLLSVRDAGGRALIAGMPMLRQYKHLDNLVRQLGEGWTFQKHRLSQISNHGFFLS